MVSKLVNFWSESTAQAWGAERGIHLATYLIMRVESEDLYETLFQVVEEFRGEKRVS